MIPRPMIRGYSMYPRLRPGDIPELTETTRERIRPGDVLVFTAADGRRVIHRVIQAGPGLRTQGDNLAEPDPPVPEESPLHLVSAFERKGKRLPLPGGAEGLRQFTAARKRRRFRLALSSMVTALARLNPCKIPFSVLKQNQFGDQRICYFLGHPVGRIAKGNWMWLMPFARLFIAAPGEDEIRRYSPR